jgi:surfeit locus 1 family protein
MGINNLHFRPQILPTVMVMLLAPLFLGLGFWQLDRAEQKRAMAGTQEARRKLPPLRLEGSPVEASQVEYRRLIARGHFLADKTILVENRKHRGRTGFHVISPLRIFGGERYLLVNRGWTETMAVAADPTLPASVDLVEVSGQAVVPAPPALDLGAAAASRTNRWPFVTLDAYREWSGLDIYPFMLLQAPEGKAGFVRNWPQVTANDAMHIGYAIQWFAFAVIAFFIWLVLSLERAAPGVEQS